MTVPLCYMTATRAIKGGGILKILNLCEIMPVYLVHRLYLSCCRCRWQMLHIWSDSGRRSNCCIWKICCGEPQYLANWPAWLWKNLLWKLWSLVTGIDCCWPWQC